MLSAGTRVSPLNKKDVRKLTMVSSVQGALRRISSSGYSPPQLARARPKFPSPMPPALLAPQHVSSAGCHALLTEILLEVAPARDKALLAGGEVMASIWQAHRLDVLSEGHRSLQLQHGHIIVSCVSIVRGVWDDL